MILRQEIDVRYKVGGLNDTEKIKTYEKDLQKKRKETKKTHKKRKETKKEIDTKKKTRPCWSKRM